MLSLLISRVNFELARTQAMNGPAPQRLRILAQRSMNIGTICSIDQLQMIRDFQRM